MSKKPHTKASRHQRDKVSRSKRVYAKPRVVSSAPIIQDALATSED